MLRVLRSVVLFGTRYHGGGILPEAAELALAQKPQNRRALISTGFLEEFHVEPRARVDGNAMMKEDGAVSVDGGRRVLRRLEQHGN